MINAFNKLILEAKVCHFFCSVLIQELVSGFNIDTTDTRKLRLKQQTNNFLGLYLLRFDLRGPPIHLLHKFFSIFVLV